MKILIASDMYHPNVNGASYFTQRLAHKLKDRGHTIAVVGPSQVFKYTKREVEGIPVYGIRGTQFLFWNDWNYRWCLPWFNEKFIQSIINEFKPDIVHVQMHFPVSRNVLTVAQKNGIPVVGTNHFVPENLVHYLHFGKASRRWLAKFLWNDFAKVFNKFLVATTPTHTAANIIKDKIKVPVQVVSNGIDIKRFNPRNKDNAKKLKEKYKIPDKPILLYVGRLDKEKNVDLMLKAAAIALEKTDFHFVIGGNGDEREVLKKLAKKLGISDHVTFTGFIPNEDLPNIYPIGDVFVIAGTAELQSLVTMEAMASGLPVIGVNAMALPELIHDEINGFQFQPGNIDELAEKIVKIFSDSDLRKRMAEKSLEIISPHDIEKTINAFEEIYRKEIAAHPKPQTLKET